MHTRELNLVIHAGGQEIKKREKTLEYGSHAIVLYIWLNREGKRGGGGSKGAMLGGESSQAVQ